MEPEIGSVPTGFLSNSLILQNFVKSLLLISLIRNLKEEGGGGGVGGKSEGGTEVRDTLNFTSFKVGS